MTKNSINVICLYKAEKNRDGKPNNWKIFDSINFRELSIAASKVKIN